MTNQAKDNGYNYITQIDLIAINAALRDGADVRIRTTNDGSGVKILKEKSVVLNSKRLR